jgi:hypothetical protein
MSAIALQRVVVRMLFDPVFRQKVYRNADTALAGVDLTPPERQWLVRPDPRAYGADAYRASRALSGLLEEYPVTGALAARCAQGIERLHGFFASEAFHRCVQERGSMAAAFGAYVGAGTFSEQPEIAPMAALETSLVQVRRAAETLPPLEPAGTADTRIGLAPWVRLLSVHPHTLPRYGALLEHLRQRPGPLLEALLNTNAPLPAGPRWQDAAPEFLLVVALPGTTDASLEPTSPELGSLLAAAQKTPTRRHLCAVAVALGAEPEEAAEIIQACLDDRLLWPLPSSPQGSA